MSELLNALKLAERLEQHHTVFNDSAAAMLRKQDEAIKMLREALERIQNRTEFTSNAFKIATNALAATEELK